MHLFISIDVFSQKFSLVLLACLFVNMCALRTHRDTHTCDVSIYENSYKTITKSEIEITNRARAQSSNSEFFKRKKKIVRQNMLAKRIQNKQNCMLITKSYDSEIIPTKIHKWDLFLGCNYCLHSFVLALVFPLISLLVCVRVCLCVSH